MLLGVLILLVVNAIERPQVSSRVAHWIEFFFFFNRPFQGVELRKNKILKREYIELEFRNFYLIFLILCLCIFSFAENLGSRIEIPM